MYFSHETCSTVYVVGKQLSGPPAPGASHATPVALRLSGPGAACLRSHTSSHVPVLQNSARTAHSAPLARLVAPFVSYRVPSRMCPCAGTEAGGHSNIAQVRCGSGGGRWDGPLPDVTIEAAQAHYRRPQCCSYLVQRRKRAPCRLCSGPDPSTRHRPGTRPHSLATIGHRLSRCGC